MQIERIVRSEIDGHIQQWMPFKAPIYVTYGDIIDVTSLERGQMFWVIHIAMVLVGCRLDGWLIETDTVGLHSVQYGSISRPEEDR